MHYSPEFCSAFSGAPGHISRILDIEVGVGGEAGGVEGGGKEGTGENSLEKSISPSPPI